MMEDLKKKILDLDGHLNDKGVSLYAEAMKLRQVGKLPLEIQEHLQSCGFCTSKVIDLFELIEELDYSDMETHPVLGEGKNMELMLGEGEENLENILQQLLDEAVELPLFENMIESQLAYRNSQSQDALAVIHPSKEQLCLQKITFTFSKAIDKKCFISLTNNVGRKLKVELPLNVTEFTIDISDKNVFTPGLYYWKVMPQGEKALVGKVFILV